MSAKQSPSNVSDAGNFLSDNEGDNEEEDLRPFVFHITLDMERIMNSGKWDEKERQISQTNLSQSSSTGVSVCIIGDGDCFGRWQTNEENIATQIDERGKQWMVLIWYDKKRNVSWKYRLAICDEAGEILKLEDRIPQRHFPPQSMKKGNRHEREGMEVMEHLNSLPHSSDCFPPDMVSSVESNESSCSHEENVPSLLSPSEHGGQSNGRTQLKSFHSTDLIDVHSLQKTTNQVSPLSTSQVNLFHSQLTRFDSSPVTYQDNLEHASDSNQESFLFDEFETLCPCLHLNWNEATETLFSEDLQQLMTSMDEGRGRVFQLVKVESSAKECNVESETVQQITITEPSSDSSLEMHTIQANTDIGDEINMDSLCASSSEVEELMRNASYLTSGVESGKRRSKDDVIRGQASSFTSDEFVNPHEKRYDKEDTSTGDELIDDFGSPQEIAENQFVFDDSVVKPEPNKPYPVTSKHQVQSPDSPRLISQKTFKLEGSRIHESRRESERFQEHGNESKVLEKDGRDIITYDVTELHKRIIQSNKDTNICTFISSEFNTRKTETKYLGGEVVEPVSQFIHHPFIEVRDGENHCGITESINTNDNSQLPYDNSLVEEIQCFSDKTLVSSCAPLKGQGNASLYEIEKTSQLTDETSNQSTPHGQHEKVMTNENVSMAQTHKCPTISSFSTIVTTSQDPSGEITSYSTEKKELKTVQNIMANIPEENSLPKVSNKNTTSDHFQLKTEMSNDTIALDSGFYDVTGASGTQLTLSDTFQSITQRSLASDLDENLPIQFGSTEIADLSGEKAASGGNNLTMFEAFVTPVRNDLSPVKLKPKYPTVDYRRRVQRQSTFDVPPNLKRRISHEVLRRSTNVHFKLELNEGLRKMDDALKAAMTVKKVILNDDDQFPDAVTPSKVEHTLQDQGYNVPFIDDEAFYYNDWYVMEDHCWSQLNQPPLVETSNNATSLTAPLESCSSVEILSPSPAPAHSSTNNSSKSTIVEKVPEKKSKHRFLRLCNCMSRSQR